MLVTKDPVITIIRNRAKYRMKPGWAIPMLAGDFIPGCKQPKMIWGDGELLETMASTAIADSPLFRKLGIGPLKLATGLELAEEEQSLAVADRGNALGRLRALGSTVRAASDDEVKGFVDLAREARDLLKSEALEDKVPASRLQDFADRAASQLEGPLHRFGYLLTAESPTTLLLDVQMFDPLWANLTKPTRDGVLAVLPATQELMASQQVDRAKTIRGTIEQVADTFTGALAYCLNFAFSGEFGLCHLPRTMSPTKAAAFVVEELVERKLPCYDVVLLNPIPDASVLTTHWGQYFNGEELAQATVFASLDYGTLDELSEKAANTKPQSGSAAAHFCLTAGFGQVLGRRCPVGPAVAAGRRKRDGLLFPRAGHFGLLESSFGCQEDKQIFGFEDIDTLALRDAVRARYAKRGVNTPALTDGVIHLFRANSLSSDLQFSQFDTTRAANWFIGTMRQYMRRVTVGQCNDRTLKTMVAAEVTDFLNAPFAGKADFDVIVTPGESADPREFIITLSLPELAYVETVTVFVELKEAKKNKK